MDNFNNVPSFTAPDTSSLQTLSKWSGFVGIMTIISGVLACLSIVGIIPGVITIILGVKLRGAKNSIDSYLRGNNNELNGIFENLGNYFKIQGILIIVSLVLGLLGLIFFIVIAIAGFSSMGYYY